MQDAEAMYGCGLAGTDEAREELVADISGRNARLMGALCHDGMAIIWPAMPHGRRAGRRKAESRGLPHTFLISLVLTV